MTKSVKGEDKTNVLNFDHVTFWVANAKTACSYFVTRFGFKPLAFQATENSPIISYAVKLNQIIILFQSPTTSEGGICKDIQAHGDFVKDVALEVNDLDEIMLRAKAQGATIIKEITEAKDEDGYVRYAILKTYGDNTHTLIDRSKYKGMFLPGYTAVNDDDPLNKLLPDTNLKFIDHVEGNMEDGTLEDSVTWYEKHLNMRRFWCVDYTHDLVPYSCINTASVINQNDTVLLSMNEAAKGLRPSSKATDFVKALGTSGVEHMALYTDDIVNTMRNLRARGADIVSFPPTYYDIIKEKLKGSSLNVKETIDELKEENILIDFDERGYMLQAFTKHVQVRPTVFLEIIQRNNHKGFGSMNYKWVFEAIELLGAEKKDSTKTEAA